MAGRIMVLSYFALVSSILYCAKSTNMISDKTVREALLVL